MRMLLMLVVLLLTACDQQTVPADAALVVYATETDPANLPELFDAFTEETEIAVDVIWGSSKANANDVVHKQGRPADVLITANVADIWRAGDEGALLPLQAGAAAAVDGRLRDPDGAWVALQRRHAVIVVSADESPQFSGSYRDLSAENYRNKLCLSSINNSVNQAVIAMLIEDLGAKPAERVVRGWVRNLAMPPFESEQNLAAALESGRCQIGILSVNSTSMDTIVPDPSYIDASAMGVGRHAENPEKAQQLVDWLIRNKPLGDLKGMSGRNIGVIGWRASEVILLAERAAYR